MAREYEFALSRVNTKLDFCSHCFERWHVGCRSRQIRKVHTDASVGTPGIEL